MIDATRRSDAYRDRLVRYSRALAVARSEAVYEELESGEHRTGLKIFVSANVNKRFERLQGRLEFLAGVMDDLDALLTAYVLEVPLAPYTTISGDADRFLLWLEESRELTAEQRDYVAGQHAHFGIEAAARVNRSGHVRFQELLSVAPLLAPELESNAGLRIHLNPIRIWSRLETGAMLDDAIIPPSDVLFYAVREDVGNAVLDSIGRCPRR